MGLFNTKSVAFRHSVLHRYRRPTHPLAEQQGGADLSDAGCNERSSVRGIHRQSAISGLRHCSTAARRFCGRGALHAESVEYIFLGSWEIKMEILDKRMPRRLKSPKSE